MQENLDLTPGQIRTVCDVLGRAPAPQSPILGAAQVPAEDDESTLARKNVFSPQWKQAFMDLVDPALEFRILEAGPEANLLQLYYRGNRQDGSLIRVQPMTGVVRFTIGCEIEQITGRMGKILWEHRPPYGVEFESELTSAGLAAWAASIDSIRALLFASLLKRLPQMNLLLDLDELNHHLSEGFAYDDARWLVTLLRSLGPEGALNRDEAASGVAELEQLGLLVTEKGGWQPSGTMKYMAATLKTPLPAATMALTFYGNQEVYPYVKYMLAMCGEGPLWTLEYSGLEANAPKTRLSSCDGKALQDTWAKYLKEVPSRQAVALKAKAVPQVQPVESQKSACTDCGKSLRPGAAFCWFCGAPVVHEKVEPVAPSCVSCGETIKPGAAFCSQCGAKQ